MSESPTVANARPAATVVLLREATAEAGFEVLMVRRARGASFMADAFVFPGGRVEPEDGLKDGPKDGPKNESDGAGDAAFARAAARELKEEAGVSVDPQALLLFARWITPSAEPKRFDARFFMAALPKGEVATHDSVEAVEHLWATPRELLQRHQRGELKLPPPTLRHLEDLAPQTSVAACLAWARARPLAVVMPKLVHEGDTLVIVLPWDPKYATLPGEGTPIAHDHPLAVRDSRLILREGRWWGADRSR